MKFQYPSINPMPGQSKATFGVVDVPRSEREEENNQGIGDKKKTQIVLSYVQIHENGLNWRGIHLYLRPV